MTKNCISTYLLTIVMLALASASASAQNKGQIELTFGMFTTDGMAEQDVFVANPANANEVIRISAARVARLFTAVTPVLAWLCQSSAGLVGCPVTFARSMLIGETRVRRCRTAPRLDSSPC